MSTIDEIMGAVGRHGDDCIRDADSASESFEALRELIAAALTEARREGAEAMREAAQATPSGIDERGIPTLDEGRTKLGPWGAADVVGRVLPTTRVKPNEINGLRAENGPAAEVAHHGRSCRCGPDGCADSRCPGRGEG